MKLKLLFVVIIFFSVVRVYSTPRVVEIWFLSEPLTNTVFNLIENYNKVDFFEYLAEGKIYYKCTPMGDGCFHPQTGYLDKRPVIMERKVKEREISLKTINAVETNLINCEKNNYFDIFCGKAKKIAGKKNALLEVWIDTSASLRKMDYNKDVNFCNRRSFVSKLFMKCGREKIIVKTYNARSIKDMGDLSSLCLNNGTNDEKRLIRWIKDSVAKKLIIITDVDEYRKETSDFLESIGAKIIGGGATRFFSKDLVNRVDMISKSCKE